MREIMFLKPVFKEVIWGGSRLKECFGYEIPSDHTGECWAISGHKNGDCEVISGTFSNKALSWIWRNHREVFGNHEGEEFPLLVKIIDAKDDLSIQVHPDDEYANTYEHGALGKTECWYVLDALEGAEIVVGHNAGTKEELCQMIDEERWNELIQVRPLRKGDFFQINPGTVHAIKGGSLILEIQQSSDVTYRLYDYDRLQDGKKRELHLEQSKDVIVCPHKDYKDERKVEKHATYENEHLVTCPYYTVNRVKVNETYSSVCNDFLLISVVEGEGTIDGEKIKSGDHFILPSGYGKFDVKGQVELFITNYEG